MGLAAPSGRARHDGGRAVIAGLLYELRRAVWRWALRSLGAAGAWLWRRRLVRWAAMPLTCVAAVLVAAAQDPRLGAAVATFLAVCVLLYATFLQVGLDAWQAYAVEVDARLAELSRDYTGRMGELHTAHETIRGLRFKLRALRPLKVRAARAVRADERRAA